MAIFKVTSSLLRRQKAYGVTIFCLSLIVSLMLCSVLTVMQRSGVLLHEAIENISMHDVMFFVGVPEHDDEFVRLKDNLLDVGYVEDFEVGRCLSPLPSNVFIGEQELQETMIISAYAPDLRNYRIRSNRDELFVLADGEVLLQLIYERTYSVEVGDTVSINGHEFIIAGFFEDPILGSPTATIGRAYVHEGDFEKLYGERDLQGTFLFVNVQADHDDPDYAKQIRNVIEASSGFLGMFISVSRLIVISNAMLVPNLILALLLSFALLSLLITLFVLRYAVLSSIEGSFVTLGVFKAVGFTGKQIRIAVMLQYVLVCLLGSVAGAFASIMLIPTIGELVMVMAGLIWNGRLSVYMGLMVVFAMTLLICTVSMLNTRKIKRISPIRAISFGRAPVYFARRLNIPLRRLAVLPLHFRMSLKQIMTRRKQYVLLVCITALLTFMAIFAGGMSRIFSDVRNVLHVFGFPKSDVAIMYVPQNPLDISDEAILMLDEIVAEIEEQYSVAIVFEMITTWMLIEGVDVSGFAYDTFDGIGLIEPLSGRFPIYDNEVTLSPVVAALSEKGIGDRIYLRFGEFEPAEFIVTGMAENINNLGRTIIMTMEGAKRLAPGVVPFERHIIFEEGTDVPATVAEIKSAYEHDDIFVFEFEVLVGTMVDSIAEVVNLVTGVSYALTAALIALITFLLTIIAMYREYADIAVFKAVGFTSWQLRLQFALRFLLVSLSGGLLGMGLSLLVGDALITFIFRFFGISRMSLNLGPAEALPPILLVSTVALIATWLVSTRVKRVSVRTLISE